MTAGGLHRPGCPRGPHVVPAVMAVRSPSGGGCGASDGLAAAGAEAWGSLRRALALERGLLLGRGSWPAPLRALAHDVRSFHPG